MTEVNAIQKQQSAADELKLIADKFLASKGVATKPEDAKKTNVKMSDLNILIAVPAYSGELKYKMALSLLSLAGKLRDVGIRHRIEVMPCCPIIQIVRDYFANKCAFEVDQDGISFSHLLFIDADSGNYQNGVLKLIVEDRPIAGLLFYERYSVAKDCERCAERRNAQRRRDQLSARIRRNTRRKCRGALWSQLA